MEGRGIVDAEQCRDTARFDQLNASVRDNIPAMQELWNELTADERQKFYAGLQEQFGEDIAKVLVSMAEGDSDGE